MKQLRGVVMCGGQSQRMGTDKGLIPIQNTCWAAYMADKLSAIPLPVAVSVNQSQVEKYQSFFADEQLIVDSLNIAGPLNGLLSMHVKYPGDDLLLLACDMINMQTETLNSLIDTYNNQPGFDFYVYQNEQFAEPFCGIYTARALANLMASSPIKNLSNLSLQKVLNAGYTKRLPVVEPISFQNYNTPL